MDSIVDFHKHKSIWCLPLGEFQLLMSHTFRQCHKRIHWLFYELNINNMSNQFTWFKFVLSTYLKMTTAPSTSVHPCSWVIPQCPSYISRQTWLNLWKEFDEIVDKTNYYHHWGKTIRLQNSLFNFFRFTCNKCPDPRVLQNISVGGIMANLEW